jgi:hypothetical protein
MLELADAPESSASTYYVLDERLDPVECTKAAWEAFQATEAATVAITRLGTQATVLTTFTGVDDGFGDEGDSPYVFETSAVIWGEGGDLEGHQTWAEAEEGHRKRVQEMLARLQMRHATPEEPQLGL